MSFAVRLCALAVVVCGGPVFAAGPVHRDVVTGFQITLPDGWQAYPNSFLGQLNQSLRQRGAGQVQYSGGYGPVGLVPGREPFVLVQVIPLPAGVTDRDIERLFGRAPADAPGEVRRRFGDVIHDLKVDAPVYDRRRNRVVLRSRTDGLGGPSEGLTVGHVGAKALVMVHGYAAAGRMADHADAYERMNDTFQFEPGCGRPPGAETDAAEPAEGFQGWLDPSDPVAREAAMDRLTAVAVVCLVAAVMLKLSRRKRPKPRRPAPPREEMVRLTVAPPEPPADRRRPG